MKSSDSRDVQGFEDALDSKPGCRYAVSKSSWQPKQGVPGYSCKCTIRQMIRGAGVDAVDGLRNFSIVISASWAHLSHWGQAPGNASCLIYRQTRTQYGILGFCTSTLAQEWSFMIDHHISEHSLDKYRPREAGFRPATRHDLRAPTRLVSLRLYPA